jgi:hypothetical protein
MLARQILPGLRTLSDAEIVARLDELGRSRGEGRAPIACLCRHLGITRPTFYAIRRRGRVAEKRRGVFSIVLCSIEQKQLGFRRRGQGWETVRRQRPAGPVPPQDKITRADEWNEWAGCRTCAGLRWAPARMGAREVMVCAACIPPDQYPAIGMIRRRP